VEFESPHLHQQGLVTDQALCLARGPLPERRYTWVHGSLRLDARTFFNRTRPHHITQPLVVQAMS
jgi:hypothetical protein